ncbi:tetratricopeptide repeat protein [bacterium]|nr:tetratricopeptide repeat protein [bacterium]
MGKTERDNPYVGPVAFGRKDQPHFYGRDREAEALLSLIISERIVLFYSQSGAGKSSLVNARLIPDLENKRFEVLPVARVSGELPKDLAHQHVSNIYTFNALRYLVRLDKNSKPIANVTLSACLRSDLIGSKANGLPRILIFDQFEEILTHYPESYQEREDFFCQVREALKDIALLTVVFVMREDHIAGLDRYIPLLPGRLRTRFRMERLRYKDAIDAVRRPAEMAGRPFDPGVAETLVDNLRQQRIAGQETPVPGEYVEPVQLQIVCWQLWENLKKDQEKKITQKDLESCGDVNIALEKFYEDTIAQVAQESGTTPEIIRRWFEEKLITPSRIRAQVAGGLPEETMKLLVDKHLIRTESARGGTWYELVHDRFIEPILAANKKWAAKSSTPLSLAAQDWKDAEYEESYLYQGQQLEDAIRWANNNDAATGELEREFLNESRKVEDQRRRELELSKKLHRRNIGLTIGFLVAVVSAVLSIWWGREAKRAEATANEALAMANQAKDAVDLALTNEKIALTKVVSARESLTVQIRITKDARSNAENQARISFSRELAATAIRKLDEDPGLSLLLALHSASNTHSTNKFMTREAEDALRQALQSSRIKRDFQHPLSFVADVAFSPNGLLLATACGDGTARIWDTTTGQQVRLLYGHTSNVNAVTFSPNGRYLATASDDGTALIWNVDSGQPFYSLSSHLDQVNAIAFSPDGLRMATASDDGTAKVWDFESGEEKLTLFGHTDKVRSIAFSPSGTRLATGSFDKKVIIWDAESGEELFTLSGHSKGVTSVAFSSTGGLLASCDFNGIVRIWQAASGQRAKTINAHDNLIFGLTFSPDGKWLATCGYDGLVKVWEVESGSQLFVLSGHTQMVFAATFSPDGRYLATASGDGSARIWTTGANEEMLTIATHRKGVEGVAFRFDGKYLATASNDSTVRIWESNSGRELFSLAGHIREVTGVAFSPDGARLVTASKDSTAGVWNVHSGKRLLTLTGHTKEVSKASYSPNGALIVTASYDGTAKLWDAHSGRELRTLEGHSDAVRTAIFSPDGKYLATAGADGAAILWDAVSGIKLNIFQENSLGLIGTAFSPDGTRLATTSKDKTAAIWGTRTGKKLLTLSGHNDTVIDVAFSPDGKTIATVSMDRKTKVWDAHSGEELYSLTGHEDEINAVAFSPDGRRLATASDDKTVRFYALNTEDLIKLGWQRATRPLTTEECRKYLHQDDCPTSALGLIAEGRRLARKAEMDAATACFRKALEMDPNLKFDPESETRKWAAATAFAIGRNATKASKTEEQFEEAYKLLAAAQNLDSQLVFDPEKELYRLFAGSLVEKAREKAYSEEIDSAAIYFDKAVSIDPTLHIDPYGDATRLVAHSLVTKGDKFFQQDKFEEAINCLGKAVDFDPEYGLAYRILGICYKKTGKYYSAIASLQKAIEIRPSSISYAELADIYRTKGEYALAIDFVNKALQANPDYDYGNFVLGQTKQDMEEYEDAITAFNKVTDSDHFQYLVAVNTAGGLYYDKLYEYKKAYERFEQVAVRYPLSSIVANFAEASLATERFKQAHSLAKDAFGKADTLTVDGQLAMRYVIICSLLLQGQVSDAYNALKDFVQYYNSNFLKYEPSWSYAGTKNFLTLRSMDEGQKRLLLRLIEILESRPPAIAIDEFAIYFGR